VTEEGREYEQFRRCPVNGGPEEVLLDSNELAAGHSYFALGVREVSPNGNLLAYSVDTSGDEVYELRFLDLLTGQVQPEQAPRSYYTGAWSADSSTFFYVVHDDLFRPYQVYRHRMGSPCTEDVLIYQEDDERFEVEVSATRSGGFIVISSSCRDTSECWLIAADRPETSPTLLEPRRRGVMYAVDHVDGPGGGEMLIVTNDEAVEFRLMAAPVTNPGRASWREVVAEDPNVRLVSVHAFARHLVVSLRRNGFPVLRIIDRATGESREESSGLAAGSIWLARNEEYDTDEVTVCVESLIDPPVWYDLHLHTGQRTVRMRRVVPTYSSADYVTERRTAIAKDGVEVPVTLAYRRDTPLDGTAPCLLYGYGAYEACIDPEFEVELPSLLDRGVVYAVAHPRGGGERGRKWWLDGRLECKRNTFTDHIAVADMLVNDQLVAPDTIVTRGLSAGGLLQGAVYSMAPKRWRAVVAEVPFVDCVTTMLDPSVPLTINEWDEWGDPRQAEHFAAIRGYAPYENVPNGPRPALLVTGSLNDPRVLIHEPAKWVAKLRATDSHDSTVLFRAEVGSASHGGPSGRFAHLSYEAEVYAFILAAFSGEWSRT
jgi:oligopeptidase B